MIRNLFTTLRRFKLASSLNIIGMSVAFAAFIVIMMQVRWEYTFGTTDIGVDSTFMMEVYDPTSGLYEMNLLAPESDEFIKASNDIVAYATILPQSGEISIQKENAQLFFKDIPVTQIFNDIRGVFDIRMKQGTFESIFEPRSVLIHESLATRLFGSADPIGKIITYWRTDLTVSGVYYDLPNNAVLKNSIIWGRLNIDKSMPRQLFVKLRNPDDPQSVINQFNAIDRELEYGRNPSKLQVRLLPVGDIYFDKLSWDNDFIDKGNLATTNILLSIAILVILIAVINFINFYTALAPVRIRGLNTRLVFGAQRSALRRNIVFEAVAISMIGFFVSLFIVDLFNTTSLSSLIKISSTTLSDNLLTVVGCGVLALVVGLVAGLYPSRYCTKFEPAVALKGNATNPSNGKWLRTTLIGVQFVISITLIICAMFVNMQHRTMVDAPLGFAPENLLIVKNIDPPTIDLLKNELAEVPAVKNIGQYNGAFGKYEADMISEFVTINGDSVQLNIYYIDHNFLPTIGIPIIEGRGFDENTISMEQSWELMTEPDMILNRTAAKLFDAKVGEILRGKEANRGVVVGITDDFVSKSIAEPQQATIFVTAQSYYSLMIRIDARNTSQTIGKIDAALRKLIPENPPTAQFYRSDIASLYAKERDLGQLITLFSAIAIIISLVGVFGLVVFETQYRRKEIGIRKVFGSRTAQILGMFNRRFAIIIGVCSLIAIPTAYFGITLWLKGFAYRTSLPWWVFAVAVAIVGAITAATVTLQSYRAASENPVKSLKSE